MVRVRRTGLIVAVTTAVTVIGAAFATEGLGLALIAMVAIVVIAGLTVPLMVAFEEERDLPAARDARTRAYRRAR